MAGLAMSSVVRNRPSPATVWGSARIQPIRRPPQKILLADPRVMTPRPDGSCDATGGGVVSGPRRGPLGRLQLGAHVRVIVTSVNPVEGLIDLDLVTEPAPAGSELETKGKRRR